MSLPPASDAASDATSDAASDAAATAPLLRADLAAVPSYVPGRPAAASGDVGYKISSNENPYPPLPSVLDVIAAEAGRVNRYPDLAASALVAAIGERYGVPASCVVPGTGSVGVLGQVLAAVVSGPQDEVVHAWRSFEAYPIAVAVAGGTSRPIALDAEARHDLPALAAAVTPRARAVLVCSPNNPTGPAVHREELERFLAAVGPSVLVVLDEAYREFVRDPQAPDGVQLWRRHPNLVVLRTFSKAYGLAGLRVGYALAHPPVADALRKTAVPFGVSGIAQAAAIASLAAEAELAIRVDAIVAERERVVAALRGQGWAVPDTQANFVWLPLGEASAAFAAACQSRGLAVRPFAGDGVRVTIGEPEASDRLLEVAAQVRPALA